MAGQTRSKKCSDIENRFGNQSDFYLNVPRQDSKQTGSSEKPNLKEMGAYSTTNKTKANRVYTENRQHHYRHQRQHQTNNSSNNRNATFFFSPPLERCLPCRQPRPPRCSCLLPPSLRTSLLPSTSFDGADKTGEAITIIR